MNLTDRHNRFHDYLRISLTPQCNLRCLYCMPDGLSPAEASRSMMQPDEIFRIAKVFTGMGVRKIRLTGGEPLVRKDAASIIESLGTLPCELAITTNGVFVDRFIGLFKSVGIRSVNVSLDSLRKEKFNRITGRDLFERVYNNILKLVDQGFHVKVNAVVMKGVNDDELNDFIALTKNLPIHVRFIEFMPFNGNSWGQQKVISHQQILDVVALEFDYLKIPDDLHDTAKKFIVPGHEGTFAIISTMTHPFCNSCNRLRVTSDGKLKNCLFSKSETDLLSALRAKEDLQTLIRNNVLDKPASRGGQFTGLDDSEGISKLKNRSMLTIGG